MLTADEDLPFFFNILVCNICVPGFIEKNNLHCQCACPEFVGIIAVGWLVIILMYRCVCISILCWFMISPASIKRTEVKNKRPHVRYYEPVGEDQKTCEAWQSNKKCPEAFSERTWDYHPNGDGSLKNCMSICSNIGEAACCYFSEKNKCWSHGLTESMKLRKNPKVLMFFPVYMW